MNDKEPGRPGDKETCGINPSPFLPLSLSPCLGRGAIILCGGQSARMGQDKNWLPFGLEETMLQRVVRLVSEAVPAEHIVCVAAANQHLPALPDLVRIVRDRERNQGPLYGLAMGLASLQNEANAIFATGCDLPLLVPAFIIRLFELLGDHPIAAPHDGERWHPLAAVYRTSVLPQVESLLAAGKRSLAALLQSAKTRRVIHAEFRDVDPQLTSLRAGNSPLDYELALRDAQLG